MCENVFGKQYPCGQEAIDALRERIGGSNVACAIDAQRDYRSAVILGTENKNQQAEVT